MRMTTARFLSLSSPEAALLLVVILGADQKEHGQWGSGDENGFLSEMRRGPGNELLNLVYIYIYIYIYIIYLSFIDYRINNRALSGRFFSRQKLSLKVTISKRKVSPFFLLPLYLSFVALLFVFLSRLHGLEAAKS